MAAAGDLITLEDCREFLQLQDGATELDPALEQTITEASTAIRWSPWGREFAPAVASEARDFYWDGCSNWIELASYDIRTISAVVVDPGLDSETTLAADEYRLGPVPARFGVYTRLEISNTVSVRGSTSWRDRRVRVTGAWGFSQVPEDVQLACKLYVSGLIRGEVQAFGGPLQPNSIGEGVNDDEAFPPGVRGLLRPYQRMSV